MVSFQCETCNDVLTKKKLDAHRNRCWDAVFTCIDCMTTFYGTDYRSHTSCMTEAQKYEGSLYKEKKTKGQNGAHTPKQAYVEDAVDSPNLSNQQVAIVDAPPPAPSPPPAAVMEPVNVFDFMVSEKSPAISGRSSASSSRSSSPSPAREVESEASSPYSVSPGKSLRHLERVGYTYGSGPVKPSLHKFESDIDFMKTIDAKFGPPLGTPAPAQTPLPAVAVAIPDEIPSANGHSRTDSQKKRKRPEVEDLDLSVAPKTIETETNRALLHSGLTGGLKKMLSEEDERMADSPLSPKKRHKRTRSEELYKRHKEREAQLKRPKDREREDHHSRHKHRHKERKALEAPAPMKAIEYHKTTDGALIKKQARQMPDQSHSEYFLSLVDKGHGSRRGMSLWGTLKMFHEGLYTTTSNELYSSATKELDEKRLFKGLRMKVNKQGEIVLFARPEREMSPGR